MTESLEELVEEFQELETPEERIQFLIELGSSMPPLSDEYCTEEFRVVGCQSMVWVVPSWDGTTCSFQATSDAPMVHGLAAILVAAYSGKTPQEILDIPIESIFEQFHLKSFLSPLRSNGLNSMIQTIRGYAHSRAATHDGGLIDISTTPAKAMAEQSDSRPCLNDLLDSIRADFPILSRLDASGLPFAYLDNAASSQRPQQVIDAISQLYETHYSNVHRSGHQWGSETTEKVEASREAVKDYIGAESTEEVIFTSGTTASINLVAQSWGRAHLQAGDEVLITEMEHHSNIVPWQQLAEEKGIVIKWIPVTDDFRLDMGAFERMVGARTKLISVTSTSNVLGTVNPIEPIAALARRVDAKLLVDAAQSVPHGPISVEKWGADFVVFSGHKMLASSGVGVLFGKKDVLETMRGWQGGGNMIKLVTKDGFTEAGLPHRFEAGTPPIAEIVSLKPAIDYLTALGPARLQNHESRLRERAIAGLGEIKGLEIYSPTDGPKCGIVSFNLKDVHGDTVSRLLDAKGIAIRVGHHCAMPLHQRFGLKVCCRASFYLYNTENEVDRLVDAVRTAANLLSK